MWTTPLVSWVCSAVIARFFVSIPMLAWNRDLLAAHVDVQVRVVVHLQVLAAEHLQPGRLRSRGRVGGQRPVGRDTTGRR
jgi:hypothetical protein